MENNNHIIVKASVLREHVQNILLKAGVKDEDSEIITDTLIEANLRGIDTHGVVRLPLFYLRRIKKGLISRNPQYKIIKKSPSAALLDADRGPGQVAALKAIRLAIEMAAQTGLGFVGIKNSSHFGIAAYFTMEALKEDMIGIALTQADARVAPFGACKAYLGTNPFSVAIPAKEELPLVLDMATSVTAMGKIILARKSGKDIPPGIAINKEGEITTDPNEFEAMLPLGGAKGSGLAIIIDVLSGVLTGSSFGPHIHFGDDFTKPELLSHLVGAINIASFTSVVDFKKRIDQMIREIKGLPVAKGFSEILLPGEKEFKVREKRLREGIPIPREIFSDLQGLEGCYLDSD